MVRRIRNRVGTVLVLAFVMAFAAMPAFAQTTPVEDVISEAQSVVTTNVPLIAAGLAVLLGAALGITALWTAFANAKKGVRSMK